MCLVVLILQQNVEVWVCVKYDFGLKGDLFLLVCYFSVVEVSFNQCLVVVQDNYYYCQILVQFSDLFGQGNNCQVVSDYICQYYG